MRGVGEKKKDRREKKGGQRGKGGEAGRWQYGKRGDGTGEPEPGGRGAHR